MRLRDRTLVPHGGAPLPSLTSAFSRRAALFGAVASTGFLAAAGASAVAKGEVVTTPPSTLDPTAESDPIFAAIARHREAVAAFEASFDESAGMVHIPPDIEDRQRLAGDVETEADGSRHHIVLVQHGRPRPDHQSPGRIVLTH